MPSAGADGVEDRRGVGLAVQKGQDRAVDQRASTFCGSQDTVARAKVTHGLGDATLKDDLSVAIETAARFGCDRMF